MPWWSRRIPRTHALFADKRNLAALGDDRLAGTRSVCAKTSANSWPATIPRTLQVLAEACRSLLGQSSSSGFSSRSTGFGGKAAYRGDKLTRRVFAEELVQRWLCRAGGRFALPRGGC
jgi:hypothetical protein